MRILLDTHAFLWFTLDDPQMSEIAKGSICNPQNEVLLSPVVYWEIAIKLRKGSLNLSEPFLPFMEDQIQINRLTILPIRPDHASLVTTLPLHHRDPFDRMLVAQAIVENVPLVTCDPEILRYPITPIW